MTIAVKTSLISILFCAILAAAYPALAQDSTKSAATRKEAVQQKIDTRKEVAQTKITATREKIASREAALKQKLEAFKDQRKAKLTEKVSTNLNKINENHTQMMLRFLNNASAILTKLENRVNQGTPDIKDATAAKTAIADAKAAIAAATEAVNAQAANDYTITVSSETRVKVDAQAQRKKLHDDLQAVRELVREAKQSVSDAIRIAKSGSLTREATPSGQ